VLLLLGVDVGKFLLALAEAADRLVLGEGLGRGLAIGEPVGGLLGCGGMFGDSGTRLIGHDALLRLGGKAEWYPLRAERRRKLPAPPRL
jgi:hypothetical protein